MGDERTASGRLLIVADDYGYAPSYDEGILAAADAGAIDAAGAMVTRPLDPGPITTAGVAVGLHLELEPDAGSDDVEAQIERFEDLFGRPPAHLDGHRHCHAAPPALATAVAWCALARSIPVRAIGDAHRRALRELGVPTAQRLIGRLAESEPAMPPALGEWLETNLPAGTTEWMVHPGRSGGPSSYDLGREEDLALLLALGDRPAWAARGVERIGPDRIAGAGEPGG